MKGGTLGSRDAAAGDCVPLPRPGYTRLLLPFFRDLDHDHGFQVSRRLAGTFDDLSDHPARWTADFVHVPQRLGLVQLQLGDLYCLRLALELARLCLPNELGRAEVLLGRSTNSGTEQLLLRLEAGQGFVLYLLGRVTVGLRGADLGLGDQYAVAGQPV